MNRRPRRRRRSRNGQRRSRINRRHHHRRSVTNMLRLTGATSNHLIPPRRNPRAV
ncbi:hypothetical protein Hanom_Chr07g00637631 [Helianthus anomalus]